MPSMYFVLAEDLTKISHCLGQWYRTFFFRGITLIELHSTRLCYSYIGGVLLLFSGGIVQVSVHLYSIWQFWWATSLLCKSQINVGCENSHKHN